MLEQHYTKFTIMVMIITILVQFSVLFLQLFSNKSGGREKQVILVTVHLSILRKCDRRVKCRQPVLQRL